MDRPPGSRTYRVVVAVATPILTWWSRLDVTGAELIPRDGPVLLVSDHDSYWDPMAIAVAARHRREILAMSKSSLWNNRIVGGFMTAMGHIPVARDASNTEAMDTAAQALAAGAVIGIFPEATRTLGRELRARSGVGRLARLVPSAAVVCVRTNGSTDVVRIPKRPRVTVEFFLPARGSIGADEAPAAFAQRLLDEIRAGAPREIPGRSRTAAKFRAAAKEEPA